MEATDWTHIKTLLAEALALPVSERAAFVATLEKCAVRDEVEALLSAHEQAENAHALKSPFSHETNSAEQVDQRVGPYRLVRTLGRGGMGSVYLAERDDGQFQQTVALKLIRRGLDTDDILSRFAFERQILAGLDHPNIARLYDGGMTDDGRPYFAMEYTEGEPVTDYCDRKRLSTQQRLALFSTVCRAVQHAHQNLVVHRDLKPSNILVTEEGEVKLLDFGIAKLLSEEGMREGPTMPRTRTGLQMLTPEYAAPEQVRGDAITTATDIYQLGVLLYELLTGRRPYRLDSRVQYEIIRVILEEEPERPSTAVRRTDATTEEDEKGTLTAETISQSRSTDPGRLQRRLAGDLDMICLTALKKEPERRYPSVEALAEDVRRHLAGLPVTARPDTFGYRASRFVRRNRVGVVAASAVLLALIIGLGAALWQSRLAAVERDRAEVALAQAEGTLGFLENMIVSGGPREGDPETPIGVVLDSASARVETELGDQPAVARAVHASLARVFFEMGRLDAAEQNARRAIELYGTERGFDYGRAAHTFALILDHQDADEESIRYHEEAIEELREAPEKERILATALSTYAAVLLGNNREAEAEAAYNESLSIYRSLDDPDRLYPLTGLALLHNYQGRFDEALPLFLEVVELVRAQHEGPHYELGEALGNVAGTLKEVGRLDEALEYRRKAVAMLSETVGNTHFSTIISRSAYSDELRQAMDFAEAQREARTALDAALATLGPEHALTAYAQNVAGQAYCVGGDPATGEPLLRASLTTRRKVLAEGHWLIANGESLLGDCLVRLGRNEAAELLLKRGYEQLRSDRGPDHLKTQDARDRLRAFYEATGRAEAADSLGESG